MTVSSHDLARLVVHMHQPARLTLSINFLLYLQSYVATTKVG